MLKCNNVCILIKENSKIICFYDMLRAPTFHARRKSLRAHYVHAYEGKVHVIISGVNDQVYVSCDIVYYLKVKL